MRLTVMGAASAMLILTACSSGQDEAPADVVAAAPAGRDAVYAAASEGPEPFVRTLYAQYVAGGPQGETPAPGQDPIFSRVLNATIGTDIRVAKGEVPSLNYDLICACQDQGVFTLDNVTVGQTDANNATAAVVFTNAGATTSQTLKLIREGPNWKVDDVVGADGKSVKDETIKVIEAAGG
ncbi:MAG: DUF3828 domain-containing protein [Pseudomonadota bacterium]